ncbi:Rpn family recombination-promoting nuclease/putative transposase [uncultured Fibrella sp.]|uniref:Rpn family recombination-promoting nuclease/putative transposase n=1 Tax=uncultured Fibrella sp. TaxID=1284596 RepID=UPI0035CC5653
MKKLVRFDWAIKKLLRQKANFGILEGFLSELLRRDVRIKQILESESNKEHLKDKFNRVDLLAELDKAELVIIEIQNNREGDYFQRMLYGTAKVLTEHISEGDDYTVLKKVISVNIVYFDLGQGQDYIYHGTTRFIGLHKNDELALSEKQKETMNFKSVDDIYPEYYVIKVNEFNDVAKDGLDEWVYFLKNAEIKRGFSAKGLKQAQEKLAFMQMSEAQQRNYRAYLENLRDDASYALTVKMDMEEMLEKATKEATEQGIQQGMQQKSVEIARAALKNGATIEFVMSVTGLSRLDVESIIKEQ